MKVRFLAAALAACALFASPAVAQDGPPPLDTPLPPPIVQRVTELERDALATKARLAALEKMVPALPKTAPSSPAVVKDEWVVPQYPGVVFTRAQLTSMYPGITFNTTAPGVASRGDPFPCEAACGAACNTTLTTPATAAGTPVDPRTYGPVPEAAADTSISVRSAGRAGGTSGCTAAGCTTTGFTSSRGGWYPGKLLGR